MTSPSRGRGPAAGTQTGKAVAVVVVMVILGWLVLHHTHTGAPSSAATTAPHHSATTASPSSRTSTTSPAPTTSTTVLPPSSVKLSVLNGTGTGQVATHWTNKLKATPPGYNTLTPNNATGNVTTSVIYIITPGYLSEANALAAEVGLPTSAVNQTVPAPSSAPIPTVDRANANLVFVVGPDLANKA